MNRLVLVMWVLVSVGGAMSMSAAADDHGKHPKQGKRMAKAMTHLDANDDGVISFDEFRLPADRGAPEMRMDSDGDGALTRDEVSNAATQRVDEALARFDASDADGNGVVTIEERRQMAFNRMDADGNGEISNGELRKAGKERRRHHKGNAEQRGERKRGEPHSEESNSPPKYRR